MSQPKIFLDDIISWGKSSVVSPELAERSNQNEDYSDPDTNQTPFPVREDLNDRIALWRGNMCLLEIDAIVAPSNESLQERVGVTADIYNHADTELSYEVSRLEGCRTGDAKSTASHGLPCRYIIHTVGPRYSAKYEIAAQNALHSCYRNSLALAKELSLSSIAFPPIHSDKRGFPKETGVNIAFKTVRKFLEHFPEDFSKIIFCVPSAVEYEMYLTFICDYFPRTEQEAQDALHRLPKDLGNEWGELGLPERKIRITSFPGTSADNVQLDSNQSHHNNDDHDHNNHDHDHDDDDDDDDRELSFDPRILSTMEEDMDTQRKIALANRTNKEIEAEKTEYLFNYYLDQARKTNLNDVAQLNLIYRSGEDREGRPIIVLVGKKLSQVDSNRATLYIVDVLERVLTKQDAVIIYFHTCIESTPQLAWLKEIHSILDLKFRQHLKGFYMVHVSWALRIALNLMKIFFTDDFWKKIRFMSNLNELYQIIDPRNMKLPSFIYRYDAETSRMGKTFEPGLLEGETL